MTRTRRRPRVVACVLAVLASLGVAIPGADAQTRLRFALDWQIQGPQAPFIVARATGAFASQGLDVTIDRGTGSQATIEKVATGTYDLGYGDVNSMIEYNVKNPGTPLIAVAMVLNTPPFSLLSLRKYGVREPKDLRGLAIGAPAGDAPRRLWPLFAQHVGLPVDSVTWTNMAPPLREPALLKGDVKAISGFYFTGYLNLAENLKVPEADIVAFKYSDHGLVLYGNAIVVRADWLRTHEDATRRFLAAVTAGFKATVRDPRGAIAHVKAAEPLAREATELKRLELAIAANMVNDEVRRNGFGGIDPARMERAIAQVATAFGLPRRPAVSEVFTDAYLPPPAARRLD